MPKSCFAKNDSKYNMSTKRKRLHDKENFIGEPSVQILDIMKPVILTVDRNMFKSMDA